METKQLVQRLQGLRRKAGISDADLQQLCLNYSAGKTKSCAADSPLWWQGGGGLKLIEMLGNACPSPIAASVTADKAELKKWRSKCLGQAAVLGWLPKRAKGEPNEASDFDVFNAWLAKYGKHKKKFYLYELKELQQLYGQLMKVDKKDFDREVKGVMGY
jgi:hypothetical protein